MAYGVLSGQNAAAVLQEEGFKKRWGSNSSPSFRAQSVWFLIPRSASQTQTCVGSTQGYDNVTAADSEPQFRHRRIRGDIVCGYTNWLVAS